MGHNETKGNEWPNDEKECTYYHELNFTDWCQFSQNEPTCTLDDVFVQWGFNKACFSLSRANCLHWLNIGHRSKPDKVSRCVPMLISRNEYLCRFSKIFTNFLLIRNLFSEKTWKGLPFQLDSWNERFIFSLGCLFIYRPWSHCWCIFCSNFNSNLRNFSPKAPYDGLYRFRSRRFDPH